MTYRWRGSVGVLLFIRSRRSWASRLSVAVRRAIRRCGADGFAGVFAIAVFAMLDPDKPPGRFSAATCVRDHGAQPSAYSSSSVARSAGSASLPVPEDAGWSPWHWRSIPASSATTLLFEELQMLWCHVVFARSWRISCSVSTFAIVLHFQGMFVMWIVSPASFRKRSRRKISGTIDGVQ